MLTSLGVKNYRNLKSLEIEEGKLARVNLIAGKNNTGKTSLLEAVSLYGYQGRLPWIDELLKWRGEFYSEQSRSLDSNLKTYSSLFHNRERSFFGEKRILLGPLDNVKKALDDQSFRHNVLHIRLGQLYEVELEWVDAENQKVEKIKQSRVLEKEDENIDGLTLTSTLLAAFDKESYSYRLNGLDRENDFIYQMNRYSSPRNIQFVRTFYTEEESAQLWDTIASTDKEHHLIRTLQLIEKDISGISFIRDIESVNGRKAVVGLRNNKNRLPLKSMGDGMNRILAITLALVNAEDGYLLIDEFENGLHYTVQEDLWRMIFQLARELNVQVFATTHSNDCIRAFESVLNDGNHFEGQYFRLEKLGEVIKPIYYSSSDLEAAIDQNIETR